MRGRVRERVEERKSDSAHSSCRAKAGKKKKMGVSFFFGVCVCCQSRRVVLRTSTEAIFFRIFAIYWRVDTLVVVGIAC